LAVAIKELRSNSNNRQNVVEENSIKALAPTAVFWNPRARTVPVALTVC